LNTSCDGGRPATQTGTVAGRAAELFGISQPRVSKLKNYKLNRFSSERLLRFVTLLDRERGREANAGEDASAPRARPSSSEV